MPPRNIQSLKGQKQKHTPYHGPCPESKNENNQNMIKKTGFDGISESFLLSTDAEENTNFDAKSDLNISESLKGVENVDFEKF